MYERAMIEEAVRVLYLDIDSTLRHGWKELGKLVDTAADVTVYPGALAQIRKAHQEGWRIVGITNQERIGLKTLTLEQLHENLNETMEQCEGLIFGIVSCMHHPDSPEPSMRQCWCRKPQIGGLVEAVRRLSEKYPDEYYPPDQALFVGNRDTDRQCAENAGIPFMWADVWRGDPPSSEYDTFELELQKMEQYVDAGAELHLGKNGPLASLLRRLGNVDPAQRSAIGRRINTLHQKARALKNGTSQ